MKVNVIEISPSSSEAKELFKLLDFHNMSHCPPEVCHLTQPEDLEKIDSILLGSYCDGILCGMGGLKLYEDYAEITRMYVKEEFRGNKISLLLLKKLELKALEKNKSKLKLETSDKFKKAFSLYKRYGFKICEPFGEYITKPHNTYMEMTITPNQSIERDARCALAPHAKRYAKKGVTKSKRGQSPLMEYSWF